MVDMQKAEIVILIVMIMILFYPFYQYTGNQLSIPSKAVILGNVTVPGGGGNGGSHHGTGREYGTGGLTGNITEDEEDEVPVVHGELPIDLGYPKLRKLPGPVDNNFWKILVVIALIALLFWYYAYIRRKTKDK